MMGIGIGKPLVRNLLPALLAAVAYYWGTRIGLAIAPEPAAIPIRWLPSALLLAALLPSPRRNWWLILLAVFPAHLAAHRESGVSLGLVLGSFIGNGCVAMLGALGVQRLLGHPLGLDFLRHAAVPEKAKGGSEARFSKIFRLSSEAIAISAGPQGPILDVNQRWQTLFGYSRGEAIGRTALELGVYGRQEDAAAVLAAYRQTGGIRELEMEMRDRSGGIRTFVFSGEGIDGDEHSFISILRDVTEQRRVEAEARMQREQLTYLTRVAALGKLSGALAHELNQPLAAILSNAQAARRSMRHEPVDLQELNEILGDIVDEDKRAGEVIRRLRAFFVKGESRVQALEIDALVRETLAIAHCHLIERKVTVVLELAGVPCIVQGDRVQLQQVLLNLVVNACEAMSANPPETRRLKLATGAQGDGRVQIVVADTGPGIEPDAMDKVFDAFFTTKANGMGFGLSISSAIVAEHGGRIGVANNPDGGAAFHITLPARLGDLP